MKKVMKPLLIVGSLFIDSLIAEKASDIVQINFKLSKRDILIKNVVGIKV